MKLKIGDIVLIKGEDFTSKVIREIEDSKYSHAAGIVRENEIIEAQGFKRTDYQPLTIYHGYIDIFTCDILTEEQRKQIVKYVENEVGSHYDWILLFLEFMRYAFHIMLPYKQVFNSNICSTLWSDAYRSVGVDLCHHIRYPSPRDLSESRLLRKSESL